MGKIKYLVMNADMVELNKIVGTLMVGEMPGETEVVVSPMVIPKVYQVGSSGLLTEVTFQNFLIDTVRNELRKQAASSTGEKAIKNVVKAIGNQSKVAKPGPSQTKLRPIGNRASAGGNR